MSTIAIIRLIDAALTLAINAGISVQRIQVMKAQSGGHLTDAQVAELARESDEAIAKL